MNVMCVVCGLRCVFPRIVSLVKWWIIGVYNKDSRGVAFIPCELLRFSLVFVVMMPARWSLSFGTCVVSNLISIRR